MEQEPRELATGYDRRNVTGTGPYHVEVAAGLHDVRFPPLCVHCGGAPGGTLPLSKMFRRTSAERPAHHLFATVTVPVCSACLAAHTAELRPPDPLVLRRLRNRWIVRTIPYWLPIGVIVYLLAELAPSAMEAIAGDGRVERLVWIGVMGIVVLALLMFVRLVLVARRNLVADHAGDPNDQYVTFARGPLGIQCVLPGRPTSVLAAVDFGDEEQELFARDRRTFTFGNVDVATAFAAANTELVYQPNAPRSIMARWAANAVAALVLLAGLFFLLQDLLGF